MALRRHRQRLVERAAAMRARPVEPAHQPRRLAVREAAQQLDDRGRAANLAVAGLRHAASVASSSSPYRVARLRAGSPQGPDLLGVHADRVARQLVAREREHDDLRLGAVPLHRRGEGRSSEVVASMPMSAAISRLSSRVTIVRLLARHDLVDRHPDAARPHLDRARVDVLAGRAGSSPAWAACTAS